MGTFYYYYYICRRQAKEKETDRSQTCIQASSVQVNAGVFQDCQNAVLKLSNVGSGGSTVFQTQYEICNARLRTEDSIGCTAAPNYLSYCCTSTAGTHSKTAKDKTKLKLRLTFLPPICIAFFPPGILYALVWTASQLGPKQRDVSNNFNAATPFILNLSIGNDFEHTFSTFQRRSGQLFNPLILLSS